MKKLSIEEMDAILLAHEIAELEGDVEKTMETVAPNPHYEFPSHGLAADGRDAVRAHYNRALPKPADQEKRFVAAERRIDNLYGTNALVREAWVSFTKDDGERVTGLYLVVMEFDPELKKITSERLYCDTTFAEMLSEDVDEEYARVPGVSPIVKSAPIINRHDAYEWAESTGQTVKDRG